jgi:hypothetical protein
LLAAADIKVSAYSFRHHAITKLLENQDVSEETAEAIAGHISHAMKKRYAHIRDERKRAALASLSRIHLEETPPPVSQQSSLTNGDVIAMLKDLPQEIVIAKIKAGPCRFHTYPDTLKQLKASGVPDAVILAMVRAS